MYALQLIRSFIRCSAQQALAYRANFWIDLFNALLNLAAGVLGIQILFGQIQNLNGWDYPATLTLLGVYLIVSALRGLFIGPSLEALAGLGQEIWSGSFDFTLLRPLDTQFLVTFRYWRLFALFDLALGAAVLIAGVSHSAQTLSALQILAFLVALGAAVITVYAVLLAFTALVFWNPAMLFTWVFDALFQLARYPVNIYPTWLRFLLTWIIPVGLVTTIPAQTLTRQVSLGLITASVTASLLLLALASWFFRRGMRRYASASS